MKRLEYTFSDNLPHVDNEIIKEYINTKDKSIIVITQHDALNINNKENTQFTHIFIAYVLSIILHDKFDRVGNINSFNSRKDKTNKAQIDHIFLINKKISNQFRFSNFIGHLTSKISESRIRDQVLSFNDIIKEFKTIDHVEYNNIKEILLLIINFEFGDFIDVTNDEILFYQNTHQKIIDKIVDILKSSDAPMHYSDIFDSLLLQGPPYNSKQSIHGLLNRRSDVFGLKGPGIFGLKSKGGLFGSIGDVAEQLLTLRNSAIKLSELENLVCNELVVSKNSIPVVLFNYRNETRFVKDQEGKVSLRKWNVNKDTLFWESQPNLFS